MIPRTLLLADDHAIVRQGLRSLIDKLPDYRVVAEAATGREGVRLALHHRPAVVIMDVGMPDLNGIDAAREIVIQLPGVKVIILSMHVDRRFVGEALRAGARGYVLKESAFSELEAALRTVCGGETYLSPRVAAVVVDHFVRPSDKAVPISERGHIFESLTPREREVLQHIAEGGSTKAIAAALGVSVKTVETHRQHVMAKLGLHSVADLTRYAIREGLTSAD